MSDQKELADGPSKLNLGRNVTYSTECPSCERKIRVRVGLRRILRFLHSKGYLLKYLDHWGLITLH